MLTNRRWPLLFVCLACAFFAFWPGLRGDFLNFDDPRTVLENPAFQLGGWDGWKRILDPRQTIADVYLPLTYLSLWADRSLAAALSWSGQSATLVYHLHSLVLHGLAGFVLLLVLTELGLGRLTALIGSLVFVAHPALAESVVWISSRKDVLSGLLALLALWLGQRVVARRAPLWPVLLVTLLACYAKATAVVLPLIGLPVWWMTGVAAERREASQTAEAAPATGERARLARLAIGTGFVCVLATLHHMFLAARAGTSGFEAVPAAVPGTLLHYFEVAAWPRALAVHRPRNLLEEFAESPALHGLWLVVIVALALVLWKRGGVSLRAAGAGILLFLLALVPFNGFAPAFAVAAADRYLYLALPGAALFVAGLAASLRAALPKPLAVPAVALAGLVLVGALALTARKRAVDFTNSERLWTSNLALYPDDDVALVNLAEWHFATGDAEAAEALLARASRVVEEPVRAMRVAGLMYVAAMRRGQLGEARMHLERAIDVADDRRQRFLRQRVELRLQLVDLLESLDRRAGANDVLDEVLDLVPDEPTALARRAELLLAARAREAKTLPLPEDDPALVEAGQWLDRAFRNARAQRSVIAITARAEWHRLRGETSAASRVLDSYRGGPHEKVALQRARLYGSEGLVAEAIAELEAAMGRHPGSLRVGQQLASLYLVGRRNQAAERLLAALHAKYPAHAEIAEKYGIALVERAREMVGKSEVGDYAARVDQAGKLVPDEPRLALLDALVLESRGRYDAALERVRAAKASEPASTQVQQAYLGLLKRCGWGALATDRKPRAWELFRELLDQAGPSVDVGAVREAYEGECARRSARAADALMARRYAEAEAAFADVLALKPGDASALLQIGLAHFGQKEFTEAETRFAQAARAAVHEKLDPGLAVLYRARSLALLDRREEAREVATAYLRTAAGEEPRAAELRARVRSFLDSLAMR